VLSRLAARALAALPEPRAYHHWLRRAQRFAAAAGDPLEARARRWITIFADDLDDLLQPELAAQAGGAAAYDPALLAECAEATPLGRLLYLNVMTYLPEDLLVKMDRCSMAHGLEARSPLLDHRLVEYVAGLPDAMKVRGWSASACCARRSPICCRPPSSPRRSEASACRSGRGSAGHCARTCETISKARRPASAPGCVRHTCRACSTSTRADDAITARGCGRS
jgi:hypothetical protein